MSAEGGHLDVAALLKLKTPLAPAVRQNANSLGAPSATPSFAPSP